MLNKFNITVDYGDLSMSYTNQYIIENMDDYKEYLTILNNFFAVSKNEIKTLKTFVGHGHTVLTGLTSMFTGEGMIEDIEKRQPMLLTLVTLQAKVIKDQILSLLSGYKLVINEKNGYFTIDDNTNCIIEKVGKRLYTENDIKISKWNGGVHYYAKVGKIDVVDDMGEAKWVSRKIAEKNAKLLLNKLNETI